MAQPDNYVVGSGLPVYAGCAAVGAAPGGGENSAWMSGAVVNKLLPMPGATGFGGAQMRPWGGWAVDLVRNRILIAGAGGHTDTNDNRCVSLDLNSDTLSWHLDLPTSNSAQEDLPWLPDGTAVSSHIYDYMHWVPQVGRVIKHGLRGMYKNGYDAQPGVIQAFNPDSTPPAWDPPSTYPYGVLDGNFGCAVDHIHGEILLSYPRIYRPATKTYNAAPVAPSVPYRYPVAYSTARDVFFTLQWGDGLSGTPAASSVLNASVIDRTTLAQTRITFNASAAYTQFVSEKANSFIVPATGTVDGNDVGYAAMCYDSINNCFYWYSGQPGRENHVYKIIPNAGTVWDMSLVPLDTSAASLPAAIPAGINGRFKYFPLLKGFVLSPDANLVFFVKTSA